MLVRLLILAITFQVVMAKNILLTTTDTWVSKNVRYLYQHLKNEGHNVMLVGPLYKYNHRTETVAGDKLSEGQNIIIHNSEKDLEITEVTNPAPRIESLDGSEPSLRSREIKESLVGGSLIDGGEFSHLLPVHQTYFRNIARINHSPKFSIKSIDKRALSKTNFKSKKTTAQSNNYGQDPLDENIWYVNSNPMDTLSITLDVLINKVQFSPEIILIGPNEGTQYTNDDKDNVLLQMLRYSKINGIPSIAISTEDNHHIYYQDEKYFNIQSQQPLKANTFSENIQFINSQVSKILEKTTLPKSISLNINFPSINHEYSSCTSKMNLEYSQISSTSSTSQRVLTHKKFNQDMSFEQQTLETGTKHSKVVEEEKEADTGAEKELYGYEDSRKMNRSQNAGERRILNNCGAAVCLVTLDGYGGLEYNLETLLN